MSRKEVVEYDQRPVVNCHTCKTEVDTLFDLHYEVLVKGRKTHAVICQYCVIPQRPRV